MATAPRECKGGSIVPEKEILSQSRQNQKNNCPTRKRESAEGRRKRKERREEISNMFEKSRLEVNAKT